MGTPPIETTQFQDQFFFVDACRNIPWAGEIVSGRWTLPRQRDPGQPSVQQFIFFTTSPGSEARETADARRVHKATDARPAG